MKIVVCVRRLTNGEINPFDACAYETALKINNAEIILLSMGPMSVKDFLHNLTRLGAEKAILLSDKAFAGADTLATSYTLSLALKRLNPDLVICGRQTIDGDTGQVGPELATMLNYQLVTNVMEIIQTGESIFCKNRLEITEKLEYPSLITVERINTLRFPSIRSRLGEVEVWSAEDLRADTFKTGLQGSPTKVITTFKNEQDRRKCTFITPDKLSQIIDKALNTQKIELPQCNLEKKLKNVWIIGNSPRQMAETISDDITLIPLDKAEVLVQKIKGCKPFAVLWGSDFESKKIAAQVAAILNVGLCADCTKLETDGKDLFMYRPAFAGDIIAKIKSISTPKMATVRTLSEAKSRVTVGLGFGAVNNIDKAVDFAEKLNAEIAASRKMVDNDYFAYEKQVGLTGKSVNPDIYIAIGISGAVHHIAGIKQSGTIIAINSDKDAEIFNYADYGIIATAEEFFNN